MTGYTHPTVPTNWFDQYPESLIAQVGQFLPEHPARG